MYCKHQHRRLAVRKIGPPYTSSFTNAARRSTSRTNEPSAYRMNRHDENSPAPDAAASSSEVPVVEPSRRKSLNDRAAVPLTSREVNSGRIRQISKTYSAKSHSNASNFASTKGASPRSADESTCQVNGRDEASTASPKSSGPSDRNIHDRRRNRCASMQIPPTTTSNSDDQIMGTLPNMYPTQIELSELSTYRGIKARETWYQKLRELVVYKEENGNTNVPQSYTPNQSLGNWVNRQRRTRVTLPERQVKLLDAIGFDWGKKKGRSFWIRRFEELKAYKAEKGDCLVPTKYLENVALGRWVSTQRSEFKKLRSGMRTTLTEENVRKLDAIGFSWSRLAAGG